MPAQEMAMSESPQPEQTPDLVVIGAGVIGLAIGWRAAQRGLRPVVLDAGEPGAGATGVAAGMLAPVTEADFGEEPLIELNLVAARRYPEFISELEDESGHATGFRQTGALNVAIDRDQAEELQRLHELQRSLGLEARWLSAGACRALEPGLATRVTGGIEAPGDHQVSPRLLAGALRAALERAGGTVRPFARATSAAVEGDRVAGVGLESGELIAASTVVVAAGAPSGDLELPPGAVVPVRPVKGQILRLRGNLAAPLVSRIVRTPEVYVVPRADGRVIVGATVEERGFDTAVTAGGVLELLRAAYEVLPGVTELELLHADAGHRPATPDNDPVVGEGALPGLVWATGHWRNGVLLAPVTADAVTDLIAGEGPARELRAFSPDRFAPAQVPG